jgi:hypothetical protein
MAWIVAGARGEGSADRRQVVERTGIAPSDELAPGDLVEDLERAHECRLEGPLAQPELVCALADADVPER